MSSNNPTPRSNPRGGDKRGLGPFGGRPGLSLWYGLSGPAGVPRPIVNAMNAAMNDFLASAEGTKRLDDIGLLSRRGSTVEEFTAFVSEEFTKLQPIIREANISTE